MDYRDEFGSWTEFLAYVENTPPVWGTYLRASNKSGSTFSGVASFQAALDLAHNGWPEGRDKLVAAMATTNKPRGTRHQVTYDVGGSLPDIARYVAGDPEYMITFGEDTVSRKPVVRIVFNAGASAYVRAETIINRGAATLSYADELETAGYSVEIYLVMVSEAGNSRYTVQFPIKLAGEAMDLDRMAFVMAHPALLRRLIFRAFECRPESKFMNAYTSTYGIPSRPTKDELEGGGYVPEIGGLGVGDWSTMESSIEVVRKGLNLFQNEDE